MNELPRRLTQISKLPDNAVFFSNGKRSDDHIFFGEVVYYFADSPEERDEATIYLNLWRKFLLRKLCNQLEEYELIDEQIVERTPEFVGAFNLYSTIGLKLAFRKKLPSELT